MPGFLGTETQFNKTFRQALKPKNTGKDVQFRDQELAFSRLDQLHKQVLPFILRRLKKDVLRDLPDKIIQDYICSLSDTQKRIFEEHSINFQVSNSFQDYNFLRKLLNHPKLIDPQLKLDIHEVPKLQALRDLFISCEISEEFGGSHKALVFSQKKRMLDIIQEELLQRYFPDVKFLRIDGSTRPGERVHIADAFNTNPYLKLLLLTTKVGGLGLNLIGADVVIFIDHDWNPINDLQAMDRAHRLGQDRVVNVYRLITENTLEERILGLQAFKTSISNHLISTENASLSSIDTTSLLSDLANIRK
jgi:TATA-binding protein-associated factor